VLGLATVEVEAACRDASSDNSVAVAANLNAPDQTVISGDPDAVARAGEGCKVRGAKRVISLKVSGAFHSPLMAPAAAALRAALDAAPFSDPAFPVVANATAQPVTACMERAAALAGAGARFIEIGPGSVLAGLLKRIVPGANVVSLGTADELTRFMEAA
jgi:[acyl-carrier-protein] S-malonyltransferase